MSYSFYGQSLFHEIATKLYCCGTFARNQKPGHQTDGSRRPVQPTIKQRQSCGTVRPNIVFIFPLRQSFDLLSYRPILDFFPHVLKYLYLSCFKNLRNTSCTTKQYAYIRKKKYMYIKKNFCCKTLKLKYVT